MPRWGQGLTRDGRTPWRYASCEQEAQSRKRWGHAGRRPVVRLTALRFLRIRKPNRVSDGGMLGDGLPFKQYPPAVAERLIEERLPLLTRDVRRFRTNFPPGASSLPAGDDGEHRSRHGGSSSVSRPCGPRPRRDRLSRRAYPRSAGSPAWAGPTRPRRTCRPADAATPAEAGAA